MDAILIKDLDHFGNAYAPWGMHNGKDVINLFTPREIGLLIINNVTTIYARTDGYMDIITFEQ